MWTDVNNLHWEYSHYDIILGSIFASIAMPANTSISVVPWATGFLKCFLQSKESVFCYLLSFFLCVKETRHKRPNWAYVLFISWWFQAFNSLVVRHKTQASVFMGSNPTNSIYIYQASLHSVCFNCELISDMWQK